MRQHYPSHQNGFSIGMEFVLHHFGAKLQANITPRWWSWRPIGIWSCRESVLNMQLSILVQQYHTSKTRFNTDSSLVNYPSSQWQGRCSQQSKICSWNLQTCNQYISILLHQPWYKFLKSTLFSHYKYSL